jgi:hypothetical protein
MAREQFAARRLPDDRIGHQQRSDMALAWNHRKFGMGELAFERPGQAQQDGAAKSGDGEPLSHLGAGAIGQCVDGRSPSADPGQIALARMPWPPTCQVGSPWQDEALRPVDIIRK